MRSISFIVTAYDIEDYVEVCLASVARAARPGDEIVVVDDGSRDGTAAIVRRFAGDPPEGVPVRPVMLGVNTPGGVGVAGNIGLQTATREVAFFVDGDDWIEAAGFEAARAAFESHGSDAMLCGYEEFDEQARRRRPPADAGRWARAPRAGDRRARMLLALSMIAVPWRKFYRRAFLREARIRFPEGPFFFEDNPFHWRVCLEARELSFFETPVCVHRINRPGQTMASTGVELTAFFTHFETILAMLPEGDEELEAAAGAWLINQMSWHDARLAPAARPVYARRAAQALARLGARTWETRLLPEFETSAVGPALGPLRAGRPEDAVALWAQAALERRLAALEAQVQTLAGSVEEARRAADGLREIERRRAVEALRESR